MKKGRKQKKEWIAVEDNEQFKLDKLSLLL